MASSFSFPLMNPADIAEALHSYCIAPSPGLRAEHIVTPQPGLVAEVLALFLANFVGDDEPDEQLEFQALQAIDNPEHHMRAIALSRLYRRANAFLHSILFRDLTLRDLLRADGRRVVYILSAIINFLHYRQDKLSFLEPIVQEYSPLQERHTELRAKIAELRNAKEDHLLKEQMEAPVVQQLEKEVNALKQRLREYNKEQLSLRVATKAIDEKKQELLGKMNQADFELVKVMQEKERLSAKIVHSPEKLLRTLEEKKAVRDELRNSEKVAMQKVQEKTNTLETYTKVSEKLVKHLSKISAVHEKGTVAKASEKDVKAHKEKIGDQNLEIKALRNKAAEWQLKVLENEGILNAKEKERDQRVAENNLKMNALKSEVESEHKCLEEKEIKIKEKLEKVAELCSQADSVAEAGNKKIQEICGKYNQVCEAANMYMDGIDRSFEEIDEAAVSLKAIGQSGA
ncbi:Kinetochore protein nuf2 [Zea mays]|uniref:Nuf2 family protein expressed n=2 Tax=Zea mays TaxID=4577 RepID=B4FUM0_MAIZE|nr:nuf2 family protein [Zea mays]ACF85813.1 unknown [Zea mays]ACR36885.1 unknown [Zea mays]ONM11584.1 Nuf2 family protein expressed [Zea mays]PWZ52979.1 Kinetochore protein nuf2 [Zea mays]